MAVAAAAMMAGCWSRPVKCRAVRSAAVCAGESSSRKLSAMAEVMRSGVAAVGAEESALRSGRIDCLGAAIAAMSVLVRCGCAAVGEVR